MKLSYPPLFRPTQLQSGPENIKAKSHRSGRRVCKDKRVGERKSRKYQIDSERCPGCLVSRLASTPPNQAIGTPRSHGAKNSRTHVPSGIFTPKQYITTVYGHNFVKYLIYIYYNTQTMNYTMVKNNKQTRFEHDSNQQLTNNDDQSGRWLPPPWSPAPPKEEHIE